MTIWHTHDNPVEWHSRLYDKKIAMIAKGLKLNKFPHPASKLSERCKYGVITSQLHRYNVACTRISDFLKPAVNLYAAYVEKGYRTRKIDLYFERFLRSHMHNTIKPQQVKQLYQRRHGARH